MACQIVIDSFPDSPLTLSAEIALAFVLTLTFPLQMASVFQIAENALGELRSAVLRVAGLRRACALVCVRVAAGG